MPKLRGAKSRLRILFCLCLAACLWPSSLDGASSSQKVAPLFRDVTDEAGLKFHHFTGATGEYFMPEIMGAGAALFDYDRDGDLDIFLVQGNLLDEKKKMGDASFPPGADWKPGHRLYRNEIVPSGRLRFTDVTERAGVGHTGYGMGVSAADIDNDGDIDLYVTHFGSNILYRNNGDGTFADVTREAGVDDERWSTSASFFDYDRDGDLDLYVANYVDFTLRGNKRCYSPTGEIDYCTPAAYRPLPDRLFRNDGKGKFTDVTAASGIGSAAGPGLGVIAADFNGDGWMDVYVANDGAANLLWLNGGNEGNRGTGKFEEAGLISGAAYGADGMARAGMGITAGDFDGDGDEDVLITNLTREGSTLYRNDGSKGFHDATIEMGLSQPSFLSTGFGVRWLDYDHDGRLDLAAANGAVTRVAALGGERYPFHQRNQLFHNEGAKAGFREVTREAGPAFEASEVSRGLATGDIDNDGDIDLLITNNNGPARLLLNATDQARRRSLMVKLEGVKDNREGIGAVVAVRRKGQPPMIRRAHRDGSYLSASDSRVHFGFGEAAAAIEAIAVAWPSGEREIWTRLPAGREITLRQGTGKPEAATPAATPGDKKDE